MGGESDADLQKRIDARFEELVSEDPKAVIPSPMVAAHQLVVSQADDPHWSAATNQAIADRFNDDLPGQFKIESVNCRTDICELRVSGYLSPDQQGIDSFQTDIYELQHQGWFAQHGLHMENLLVSGVDNGGPSLFIVYLTRK